MSSITALNSGITGIQRGFNSARGHAAQIASASAMRADSPTDLADPLVGLISDRLQVQASAKVVKAIDQMLGSLIDIRA